MGNEVNPEKLNDLLKMAGQKLGKDPQQLKQQLQNGKVENAINNLKPADAAKLRQILQNPQLAEQLLSTPQARQLFKKLTGEK